MKAIIVGFWNEPVLILGAGLAAAPILVEQSVIAGWVGVLAAGVLAMLQRHFVQRREDRPRLND